MRRRTPRGQELVVGFEDRRFEVSLPLIGDFQASNALVAAGLVIATGGDPAAAIQALEALEPVPGRLQLAGRTAQNASVYIDYAHTPDALDTLLSTLRPYTQGRLHLVFGCGGDRDSGKRPMMGAVAAKLADHGIEPGDDIVSTLLGVEGLRAIAVPSWPWAFGATDWRIRKDPFWSHFLQNCSMNVVLRRFGARAHSLLNVDIDELVHAGRGRSVHELAKVARSGFITFKGQWVEPIAETAPADHRGFQRLLHQPFRFRIECAGRFVKQ